MLNKPEKVLDLESISLCSLYHTLHFPAEVLQVFPLDYRKEGENANLSLMPPPYHSSCFHYKDSIWLVPAVWELSLHPGPNWSEQVKNDGWTLTHHFSTVEPGDGDTVSCLRSRAYGLSYRHTERAQHSVLEERCHSGL